MGNYDKSSKRRYGQILLAFLLVILAIVTAWSLKNQGTGTQNQVPLRIAAMTWGGAGPGFVGIERGLFDDLRIEVKIIDDSSARQAAYESADFEIILTNPDQHPREKLAGLPGSMILLSDISMGADGVIAHPSVATIADLKGKNIVYVRGAASDLMISKALESAGLSRNDVNLMAVDDPSVSVAALKNGEVAAAVSWEPVMSQAVTDGQAKILFTSADVPGTILGVFVAKEDMISSQPRLEKFIRGWLRSVDYVLAHPKEANQIMAKAFGVSGNDLDEMMSGLELADLRTNIEWFKPSGGFSKLDRFSNDAASYWFSQNLLGEEPPTIQRWTEPSAAAFIAHLAQE